ncbi:MAG: hypothetical protein U9Q81_19795 [Pseudomonadota bacterium]|nr:hypothetical protein [Pseudomonadota bacterium]
MPRENLSADGVSKYPAQFVFLLFFAALGGLKVYNDFVGVSNGAFTVADVGTDYTTAIIATVTFFVVMKMKLRRRSSET